MEVQILKQEYKDSIRTVNGLKGEIAAVNNVSTWTVDRWRYDDDPMLTTATNLTIIRKRCNLAEDVILTEPKKTDQQQPAGKVEHASVV